MTETVGYDAKPAFAGVHAGIVGLAVGLLAGYGVEVGLDGLTLGAGAAAVALAAVVIGEGLPDGVGDVGVEQWSALVAYVLGSGLVVAVV